MQRSTLAKRGLLLLLLVIAICYGYGLGRAPLIGSDEPRYAEVAREMYVHGDLVTPTLGGHTWFEKPALGYWGAIMSFKLFGVSEWSARVGAACAGLLTVLLLGWLARQVEARAGGEARGLTLAVTATLASTAGLMVFSRALNFDIYITLATTGALGCFCAAELGTRERRTRRLLLAGFYGCMGVGLLAKGLLGIVLPVGVIGLYYLLRRKRPDIWLSVPWGVPLMLLVAAVWYAPVIARNGWPFIDQFFVQHHFARYVSNKYHHPQPFYFYLPVLAVIALPWTAYLATALAGVRAWRWRGNEPLDVLRVFALAWLVAPVAFFSLSSSKLPGYILPALPGAALLAGEQVARYLRDEGGQRTMRATGLLLLIFAGSVLVYNARMQSVGVSCALLVAAPALLIGVCALVWPAWRRLGGWGTVGTALLTVVMIAACALAPATRRESVRDLLQMAAARGYAHAPVYGLHTIDRTAEFYAADRLGYDANGEPRKLEGPGEVYAVAQAQGGPVLIIVPVEHVRQLTDTSYLTSEMLGVNGAVALVAVRVR